MTAHLNQKPLEYSGRLLLKIDGQMMDIQFTNEEGIDVALEALKKLAPKYGCNITVRKKEE